MGVGSFGNANFVKMFGMHKMINTAIRSIVALSIGFLIVSIMHNGTPPFYTFMIFSCMVFLGVGVVFGNVNALGMQSMGRVAGLASSLFASISSLVAVLLSSLFGSFYSATITPIILIFLVASGLSFILVRIAQKSIAQPV